MLESRGLENGGQEAKLRPKTPGVLPIRAEVSQVAKILEDKEGSFVQKRSEHGSQLAAANVDTSPFLKKVKISC